MVQLLRASQWKQAIRAPTNRVRGSHRARHRRPARPKARDTEEGPPRTDGVVPLPRSERERGKARSASGGAH
ncbi:hypothetical protein C8239_01180 [Paracidovorax avenae]|nr:hypothetical protein C8239_01180 [Paracidovorax avenae]